MKKFDKQEELIVRELIRNPRLSDNKISKRTGVPVMTVNRKRKRLEKDNVIQYMTNVRHSNHGLSTQPENQLYIIKFRPGVTQKKIFDLAGESKSDRYVMSKHIVGSYIGEVDGSVALILIVAGASSEEITEIVNSKLTHVLDPGLVEGVITTRLNDQLRANHNYILHTNVKEGTIDEEWRDDWIYVD